MEVRRLEIVKKCRDSNISVLNGFLDFLANRSWSKQILEQTCLADIVDNLVNKSGMMPIGSRANRSAAEVPAKG